MISHEHKCIFIHIPRTAGTSIETAIIGKDWMEVNPSTKHITWRKAKQLYSNYWNKYFKFSVVRNVWDRLVSLYVSGVCGRLRNRKMTWDEYLSDYKRIPYLQSNIVGKELDLIIDFDELQHGFNKLCDILNIHKELPHINKTKRNHYRHYYNEKQKEMVYNIFRKDIDRFGWEF